MAKTPGGVGIAHAASCDMSRPDGVCSCGAYPPEVEFIESLDMHQFQVFKAWLQMMARTSAVVFRLITPRQRVLLEALSEQHQASWEAFKKREGHL